MIGHFFIIIIGRLCTRIPQAPVVAEVAVGEVQGAVFRQLPVNTVIHFPSVDSGVRHGFFVSVNIFEPQFFQVGTAAGTDPAPAFAASFQLGIPPPGVIRATGCFKLEVVVCSFFCNDVDDAAGGIIIQKITAGRSMQNLDPVYGHYRRRHVQIVGSPSVRKTAFQILFATVDEYCYAVVSVNTHHLMGGVKGTGGYGDAGSVRQGFRYGFIMVIRHFFGGDDGSGGRGLGEIRLCHCTVGSRFVTGQNFFLLRCSMRICCCSTAGGGSCVLCVNGKGSSAGQQNGGGDFSGKHTRSFFL